MFLSTVLLLWCTKHTRRDVPKQNALLLFFVSFTYTVSLSFWPDVLRFNLEYLLNLSRTLMQSRLWLWDVRGLHFYLLGREHHISHRQSASLVMWRDFPPYTQKTHLFNKYVLSSLPLNHIPCPPLCSSTLIANTSAKKRSSHSSYFFCCHLSLAWSLLN